MNVSTLDLELQELHNAVTGTSSHSMTIRTLAYPLTIHTLKFTAKSEYSVSSQIQEIYAVVKIKASGVTFQSERIAVNDEMLYSCTVGETFEKNTTVTIQVLFYRAETGTTSARHLFYQGYISAENTKQASYGLDITSTKTFYSQMEVSCVGAWNTDEKNDGYPYTEYSSSELFTVYSEPKRWDLWKQDNDKNDGYPYIVELISESVKSNVYVYENSEWKPVKVFYKDKDGLKDVNVNFI